MNANPRTTNTPVEPDAARTFGETLASFAALMHRSVERIAGLQKTTLDVFSKHAADVTSTFRKIYPASSETPGSTMPDLTDQALESWIGAQKSVVDLMVDQSAQVVEATKIRETSVSKSLSALSEFAQKAAARTVEAQKVVLDYAARQNKVVADLIRKHPGSAGSSATEFADSLERGLNSVIDTQKEVLATASKFTKADAARA
jgi:flagellar hook-basal body complex protein FliE